MSIIKKYSLKNSGIKLYRNGFRVLPYGEWGDDWLSLDKSTRRRSILPTHTNQNFFGYVEISDESGDFEETSSREGLLNNEAFVELQNFIYRSLVSAVIKIAEQRNLKIVSGQKQQDDGQWEEINVRVKNIAFTGRFFKRLISSFLPLESMIISIFVKSIFSKESKFVIFIFDVEF